MLYQLGAVLEAIIIPLWNFFALTLGFSAPIFVIASMLLYIRHFLRMSMTSRIGFAVLLFGCAYVTLGFWSVFYIPPKF